MIHKFWELVPPVSINLKFNKKDREFLYRGDRNTRATRDADRNIFIGSSMV